MSEQDVILTPSEFSELRAKLEGCRRVAEVLCRSKDKDVGDAAVLAVQKFDAALDELEKSIFMPRAAKPHLN
jgi:hypothetical protein